jgi:hypothetical protein
MYSQPPEVVITTVYSQLKEQDLGKSYLPKVMGIIMKANQKNFLGSSPFKSNQCYFL